MRSHAAKRKRKSLHSIINWFGPLAKVRRRLSSLRSTKSRMNASPWKLWIKLTMIGTKTLWTRFRTRFEFSPSFSSSTLSPWETSWYASFHSHSFYLLIFNTSRDGKECPRIEIKRRSFCQPFSLNMESSGLNEISQNLITHFVSSSPHSHLCSDYTPHAFFFNYISYDVSLLN